jgi:hypothetical protein
MFPPLEILMYNNAHPLTSLDSRHYYQPSFDTQSSFDSFIYNEDEHQITMFQNTVGANHTVKVKGFEFLYNLALRLKVPNMKLRFVALVESGGTVECPLPMAWFGHLDFFSLEISEDALFAVCVS